MAEVRLDRVGKRYASATQAAVRDVSVDIGHGELFVLLGPSGCGKSTTLRMIAGLEDITDGTLEIDGRRMNGVAPKDRDIAMVFQSYALYPHMTVRENLAFGLRRRALPTAVIDQRVGQAAAALGLEPYLERKPHALSGGQRQRVALGRAIVRDPKVFLFDEPLSNLDAALRVSTRMELVALHERLGATMVYVTHDQVEAMTMGTRICIMNAGRVEQVGPPLEVYRHPANTFVASFLGSPPMNLLRCVLRRGAAGQPELELPQGRRVPAAGLAERHRDLPADGTPVVWGIRPEDVGASDQGDEARVEACEALGGETLLSLRLPGAETVLRARVDRRLTPARGEILRLRFGMENAVLFDAGTGASLARQP